MRERRRGRGDEMKGETRCWRRQKGDERKRGDKTERGEKRGDKGSEEIEEIRGRKRPGDERG